MLTITDIAKRYRVSRDTVASWIRAGQLTAIDVAPAQGRHRFYRVSEESLAAFERARQTRPEPRPQPPTQAKVTQCPKYV